MSINVTVNGNRLNVRRGRMVLSDLDQIKKNERDRRRRLRLEQVRQQSREISDRLLKRTKSIAKGEFRKNEEGDKRNVEQTYNEKIMEVQQKYQEDMADIGQAHVSAALEQDHEALIEEREMRNKSTALKRGKEAVKHAKDNQSIYEKESCIQQQHQERLRQVRDVENIRSTMIANLPKQPAPEEDTICVLVGNDTDQENRERRAAKKKAKTIVTKQSPRKISKTYVEIVGNDLKAHSPATRSTMITVEESLENDTQSSRRQPVTDVVAESLQKQSATTIESEYNGKNSGAEVRNISTRLEKARYNPEDYEQTASDSTNSDSSNSFSDDSSYFSDSGEQSVNTETKRTRHVKCPAFDKVQLYDHSNRQTNIYEQPVGVVEKIRTWNEPSAIDLAQEMERTKTAETQLSESRKQNAQKRGEDAALREKVRRDYQALLKNLNQLANEERKLKASQADHYPKDANVGEERRRMLRDQHKKKLNRALKALLNEEQGPIERQITLTPREGDRGAEPRVAWEDPCFSDRAGTSEPLQKERRETSVSREEQILDMLKKVERQKRLLLQEFGADLPNEIFSASVRPLFDKDKSAETQANGVQSVQAQRPLSPEIRVISASPGEKSRKDRTETKTDDSSVKTVETAVQTAVENRSVVQDKGTQVELERKRETAPTNAESEIPRYYPLEPHITVIRPEVDSSDSTSSETIRAATEVHPQTPRATPKKKRYAAKARKSPSKVLHKPGSSRPAKGPPPSPAKKFPKSSVKSQHSSPQKHTAAEDVPSKRIRMYVDKGGVNITVKPPQVAEVDIDVSTQSTQVYTTCDRGQSAAKSQWVQTKSKRIKIKDVSDTSTSFASPPPVQPRDLLEALSNNMSILEMLDSSANESMRRLRRDVSPVSTPETPSPRTMRIPSNIPHPSRLQRLLRHPSTDSQTNDNNTPSSGRNDYSTSTDLSEYPQNEHLSPESATGYPRASLSLEFCLCNNPECGQMHAKFDEIRSYAVKNCPQILQKYEDLQTTCAERIISLTNLIEKVRSEQRGMEFSMGDPHDETSLMQLPPPQQVVTNDLQSVRKLVENIEAIHNQLAKTLVESQKIIKDKVVIEEEADEVEEAAGAAIAGTSTKPVQVAEPRAEAEKGRAKPTIINEEKVKIQLHRLQARNSLEMLSTSTPKRDAWSTPKNYEKMVIERLSKEILEQSEGINNNIMITKETYNTVAKSSVETSTEGDDSKNNVSSKTQRNDAGARKQANKESKKPNDFVPLLLDIPKVSKTTDNVTNTNNGRSKPPVSLLSGPYRSEIESSGHELSTIIEFDTPDTVNKSQNNKSPSSARKLGPPQTTRTTASKPLEHPSPSMTKLSSMMSARKIIETSISFDSPATCKNMEIRSSGKSKDSQMEDIVQVTRDRRSQCDTVNRTPLQTDEAQRFCGAGTDANKECMINKDKITSTSSNSFSELSGVSQIASTPSSTILRYASSPEEMETALKKLGLGWAITTLKKTREASALSSSSNSDATPINTAKRIISPVKKQFDSNYGLPDFSDVSSISIKEASKSTEQAVLLKGRTSTPKLPNSNSNSLATNTSNTNNSENFQDADDGLIVPNLSLTKSKSNLRRLENE